MRFWNWIKKTGSIKVWNTKAEIKKERACDVPFPFFFLTLTSKFNPKIYVYENSGVQVYIHVELTR